MVAVSDESTRREPDNEVATLVESGRSEVDAGAGGVRGRYIPIEEIGRGGMGAVVRAYDPKLEREVALKLVRREVLDDKVRQRVIREARAMAKLSHPNVVAVYDVEEADDGELRLVMELVVGQTLRRFAKSASTEQVLHALRQAGRGLAAAHEAGLLHRDFKPDNVLVGDDGRVRVTDFGLAKVEGDRSATDDPYASQDVAPQDTAVELTEAGVVVGTPRYMAPEQHDGAELSASTDQYGFCVAAWEMLAGRPPFAGPRMRDDKHVGPPGWDHSQVVLASSMIAALRRGMAPDPADRFPSMDELLAQLQPRPSRRGRWVWAALGVAGLAGGLWQITRLSPQTACTGAREQFAVAWGDERRAEVQRALLATEAPYAAAVTERVTADLDRYAEDWIAMHDDACEATAVRGEQSEQMLDLRMACLRRARERVRAASQVLASSDRGTLEHADEVVDALPNVDDCADLEALSSDPTQPPKELAVGVEEVEAQLADADALLRAGRFEESERAFLALITRAEEVGYGPALARVRMRFGDLMGLRSRFTEADTLLGEALRLSLAHEDWDAAVMSAISRMHLLGAHLAEVDQASALRPLVEGLLARVDRPAFRTRYLHVQSAILGRSGRSEESLALLEEVVRLRREQEGDDSWLVADALVDLTSNLLALDDMDRAAQAQAEAQRIYVEAFGSTHPATLIARQQGAQLLRDSGRFDESLFAYQAVYADAKASLGEVHRTVQTIEIGMAQCLSAMGRRQEAEALARHAVEGTRKVEPGQVGSDELQARIVHAQILGGLGRSDEAQRQIEAALRRGEELFGERSYRVAEAHVVAASTYAATDPAACRRHSLAAVDIFDATVGPSHRNALVARRNLAVLAVLGGEFDEAVSQVRKAIDASAAHPTERDPRGDADLQLILAIALLELGEHGPALAAAEVAYAVLAEGSEDAEVRLEATLVYARARWSAGVRREELVPLLRAAIADAAHHEGTEAMRAEAEAALKTFEAERGEPAATPASP